MLADPLVLQTGEKEHRPEDIFCFGHGPPARAYNRSVMDFLPFIV